jgi:CRISPR-associated protein Cas1
MALQPGSSARRAATTRIGRPRPARAALSPDTVAPDLMPARMLNEFVYCRRLFFYEWVEGVFVHSADTVEGAWRHQRVDARDDALPPAEALDEDQVVKARSVSLSSDVHGITAKIDMVEAIDGRVSPIDYKKGRPMDGEDGPGAWPADEAQVCVQALVLRENGYRCDEAVVYYHATRQRVRVAIGEDLVARTLEALGEARRIAEAGVIPPPLVESRKCPRCSLVGVCLPDETRAALAWTEPVDDASQPPLFEIGTADVADAASVYTAPASRPLRPLIPASDDLRPLYVTGFGMTVGRSGDVLEVREKTKRVQDARLGDISQVNLFGPVTVTGGAVHTLCGSEKPIAHFSMGGWFEGMTTGIGLRNVFLRQAQFRRADEDEFRLFVARALVANKVRNHRVMLQRNHEEPPVAALRRLKELARQAERCWHVESLLGIEGLAGRIYFEHFGGMLKHDGGEGVMSFSFTHRNRRPPRDPVNALLSLAYALLVKDLTVVCLSIGFDPFMGYYHRPRFGRPALALDLMECFRPLIAESAVLTAVNSRMVSPDDFLSVGRAVTLTPKGRRGLIQAYEQRMDAQVTHPDFGYRVSYRRVLEVHARLFARLVTGEVSSMPRFETR